MTIAEIIAALWPVVGVIGGLFGVWCSMDKKIAILQTRVEVEKEATLSRSLLIAALRVEDQEALKVSLAQIAAQHKRQNGQSGQSGP